MDQRAAHLVGHGQRDRPQVIRSPQLLDRGQQSRARVGLVGGGHLVQLAQHCEHARELVDRRATARLGRVRGHDQTQFGLVEHRLHRVTVQPRVGQRPHGLAERAVARNRRALTSPRGGPRAGVGSAQTADPLVVLGQIDELKPARQRAHQHLGALHAELAHERCQRLGGSFVTGPRVLPQRDRPIQQGDRLLALGEGNHLSQQPAEQRLVVAEAAPLRQAEVGVGDRWMMPDQARTAHPRRCGSGARANHGCSTGLTRSGRARSAGCPAGDGGIRPARGAAAVSAWPAARPGRAPSEADG